MKYALLIYAAPGAGERSAAEATESWLEVRAAVSGQRWQTLLG